MKGYYMKVVTSRGRSFFLNHPMFAEKDFLTPINRKKGKREKKEEVILLKNDMIFSKDGTDDIHTINEGKDVYVIDTFNQPGIGSNLYTVKKYQGDETAQYLTGDLYKIFYYYVRITETQKDDIDDYLKRISDGLASGNQVVIETESGVEPKLTVTNVDTIKRSITISKRSCTMFHPYSGMSILFIVGKYPIIKESKKVFFTVGAILNHWEAKNVELVVVPRSRASNQNPKSKPNLASSSKDFCIRSRTQNKRKLS